MMENLKERLSLRLEDEIDLSPDQHNYHYLSIERQLLEIGFFISLGLYLIYKYQPKSNKNNNKANEKSKINGNDKHEGEREREREKERAKGGKGGQAAGGGGGGKGGDKFKLNLIEHLFGLSLLLCLFLQASFNLRMGGIKLLCNLLFPCHAVTTVYLFCLYLPSYTSASKVFNVGVYMLGFTALALAVPDTSDLQLPFHIHVFWAQHILLLLLPIYLLASRRFFPEINFRSLMFAIGWGFVYGFVVQAPLALVTGVNINYMLWPPPGQPLAGPWYRWFFCSVFASMFTVTGYLIVPVINRISKILH
eukprot:TRINITY_DN520_c0_g3_i2.p1 TRINITY_DN520_c0_g3~~TRINITY_DN520_c0_g3_i2.p1  ORF type:complete len:336 (-),score=104.98 TRINITY_DN520_c0_g3_i2:19-939(-)